jgi:hypothetical protein
MKRIAMILAISFIALAFVTAQDAAGNASGNAASGNAAAAGAAVAAPAETAPAATATPPAATPATAPRPEMALSESARYVVYSEGGAERAADLDARLEALFGLYNGLFHFDPAALGAKLHVREFSDKAGFDAYLNQVAGQTKDDFVYLHYTSLERSELLLFARDGDSGEASLAHQAFVQYLKAFVKNPPVWMRDGFAVYYESARWDAASKTMTFPENLSWLETAKALQSKGSFLPLARLLAMGQEDSRASLDVFYPEAWAFASFLVNAKDKAYNRLLWDSISTLKRDAALADNQAAVGNLVASWYGVDAAQTAFNAYLSGRKTFGDLLTDGVAAYNAKTYDAAKAAFEAAAALDSASYVPPYYLGLIAYNSGDYSLAEYNYRTALKLGCDPATTNYALGVNAFAQNRMDEAKTYLTEAKTADTARYGSKADELLKRLGM